MTSFFLYFTYILLVAVAVILILLVLIQKGRGGGLSGAFGGGGGNTAFGSKTGDVLTWATSIVFGVFLLLGIILNIVATNYNTQKTGASAAPMPAGPAGSSLPQPVAPEPAQPVNPTPTPTPTPSK